MRLLQVAAVGALGVMTLACGMESSPPTQPTLTATATEPRPDPPPPVSQGARRIEVGAATSDALTNPPASSSGCPPVDTRPGWMMPCRHFEVLAPGDGVLFVEVVWSPEPGAEGVALIIAGVTQRLLLGGHRVLAGAAYGITVVYSPSHTEYLEYSRPVGEFSIKTTFESRRWL